MLLPGLVKYSRFGLITRKLISIFDMYVKVQSSMKIILILLTLIISSCSVNEQKDNIDHIELIGYVSESSSEIIVQSERENLKDKDSITIVFIVRNPLVDVQYIDHDENIGIVSMPFDAVVEVRRKGKPYKSEIQYLSFLNRDSIIATSPHLDNELVKRLARTVLIYDPPVDIATACFNKCEEDLRPFLRSASAQIVRAESKGSIEALVQAQSIRMSITNQLLDCILDCPDPIWIGQTKLGVAEQMLCKYEIIRCP